ncbi:MAG: LysR family transcriptional regulator [Caldilineaceae bacterium]
MELYQLRSFVTVAEEKSVTRAAERLFTTPPSISAHIKALEEEWKVTLFMRTPRGMQLTRQGEQLWQKAEAILAASDALLHDALAMQNDLCGELMIGINANPSYLQTGALAAALHQRYPQLTLNFVKSMTGVTLGRIEQGTLDAAFIFGPPNRESVCGIWLDRVDLVLVAPKAWEERVRNASWSQLAELPRISTGFYCPFDAVGDQKFQQRGLVSRRPTVNADDDGTKLELVIAEVGVAVLERNDVQSAVDEGKVIAFAPEAMYADLHFIHLAKRSQEPALAAMRQELQRIWKPPALTK